MVDYEVIVVGAGQAGLAMGYYLKKAGVSFLLVDAHSKVGASWYKRYQSLVLFTPRKYSALPGLKMKGMDEAFPTKDEVAAYLKDYVTHYEIPVQHNTFVQQINQTGRGFQLITNHGVFQS